MIDPTATYVDVPLSNQITEWNPGGFIADQIFTRVPVAQQGGGFYVWNRADRFRLPSTTLRAPGTRPRQAEFRVGTDTFWCPNYALGGAWTREELKNAGVREKYRSGKAQGVKGLLQLDYERRVTTKVLATANVGSYTTPVSLWSDLTDGNSDPIGDLRQYKENVRLTTGFDPNRIAMGKSVRNYLVNHASIRNRLFPHGTGSTQVTDAQLAEVFGVDQILVGGAQYNTAADDSTGFTLSELWGRHLLLYYASGAATVDEPEYGKSFRWEEEGFPEFAVSVHDWDSQARSQPFDVGYYGDEKLTYTDLAFLVQSCV